LVLLFEEATSDQRSAISKDVFRSR